MIFCTERRRPSLVASRAKAARPRCARKATLVIESLDVRASLSGLAVNPILGFNPQPNPQAGATPIVAAQLAFVAPHHTDVPPGPC
jgi:hypothetical protein